MSEMEKLITERALRVLNIVYQEDRRVLEAYIDLQVNSRVTKSEKIAHAKYHFASALWAFPAAAAIIIGVSFVVPLAVSWGISVTAHQKMLEENQQLKDRCIEQITCPCLDKEGK